MNRNPKELRDTMRGAYRGTRSAYGRECLKLTMAVLAKQLTPEEFKRDLSALDARFGKNMAEPER